MFYSNRYKKYGIHDCKAGRQKQHRGYHFEFLGVDGDE